MTRKYTCQRCGAPGHGKDDCGTSRNPTSGPLVTTIDVVSAGTRVPPVDYSNLHQTFSGLQPSFRENDDFIAPTRVETETASIAGIPEDLTATARMVLHTHGFEGQRADDILLSAVKSRGLHRDTMLLPGDHAASEVSRVLSWSPEHAYLSEALVGTIRRGEIVLSGSELEVLQAVHSGAIESQQLPDDAIAEDAAWQVPFEQRNCTQCGQFVGRLLSHTCPPGGLAQKIAADSNLRDKGKVKALVVKAFVAQDKGGSGQPEKVEFATLDNPSAFTVEELQDAYLQEAFDTSPLPSRSIESWEAWNGYADDTEYYKRRTYNGVYIDYTENHQSAILMSYVEKPLFGEPRIVLPEKLRQAYLEKPPSKSSPAAMLVPQLIQPPLTKDEIGRLLDTSPGVSGDYGDTARILLATPQTKELAESVITNTPTESGKVLAKSGSLSPELLSEMSYSGDQMVRRQAAGARNLPQEDLYRLATDPDPDVRATIVIGQSEEGASAMPEVEEQMGNRYSTTIVKGVTGYGRRVRRGELSREGSGGVFYSPLGNNPGLLSTFVNDPDDDIAAASLASYPDRRGLEALGLVTSRKRLQRLHDALPYLWGSSQVYGEDVSRNNDLPDPKVIERNRREAARQASQPSRPPASDGTPWEDTVGAFGSLSTIQGQYDDYKSRLGGWDEIEDTLKVLKESTARAQAAEKTTTRRDQLIAQGQEIIRKRLAG